tara:strand:- start:199 stop:1149 length:951 start_codon:yes stop_codon:yes gene_type:complete
MERIVLNACGIKSKGGITVLKNLINKNDNVKFFLLYDNKELDIHVNDIEKLFIRYPRFTHPLLNILINKETLTKINSFNKIIHLGNFGFRTNNYSYTFIQNILPLVNPYSSFRNFILRLLYLFSFKISDEIIVQKQHVSDLIPESITKKIIGNTLNKSIAQSKNEGFVVIFEDVKNKNPDFLINLILELTKQNHKVDVICSTIKSSKLLNSVGNNQNINYFENIKNEEVLSIFKKNRCYIHTSKYETVGLPIYEALESGLKVVVPDESYISLENHNIFKFIPGNLNSAVDACLKATTQPLTEELEVPVYYENWNLI